MPEQKLSEHRKQEIMKVLRAFDKDMSWFMDNYAELEVKYNGEFVAVKKGEVKAHSTDYATLLKKLKSIGEEARYLFIEKVSNEELLLLLRLEP